MQPIFRILILCNTQKTSKLITDSFSSNYSNNFCGLRNTVTRKLFTFQGQERSCNTNNKHKSVRMVTYKKKNVCKRAGVAQFVQRLRYVLDNGGIMVQFPTGEKIFLFSTASRLFLGLTHPPIQWVTQALSYSIEQPGHEVHYSPPSSTTVNNALS